VPSLRLIRDSGYADYLRAYAVILDDRKICELRNGETHKVVILAGSHWLSVRISWCGSKSVSFTATEGEDVTFLVKSNCRGWRLGLALWYVLFAWNSYIRLNQLPRSDN
jgi:hypothetical protein